MKVYLAAVLEQHNEPSVFDKRDRFVRLWKNSIYDVFQVVRSGQKKLLKNEMKRLTKEWEYELDDRIRRMGRDEYNARVAKFVGSLIPGRKDQALPSALYPPTVPATPPLSGEAKHQMSLDIKAEEEEIEQKRGCPGAKNDLLDALRAPPDDLGERKKMSTDDTTTVTDIWYSISAVQKIRPRDILPMLMHLFP
ncbi:hypothetical protein BKA66DRAFT_462891 [Pyrenochaeta sp. MPI-SDFR-AT-0127]|nr:hypothetical protein BKA66DRAFT_462891 [Pyrenochaeta sp. MPI-SDFR-AT-0127]